ncbi:MAG: tRNA (adenosine(37)-N6)-threonylcarbamoyltransferase complex dimerization subunit type 1 TsaB, partial [Pseudobdellovibrio sp.]
MIILASETSTLLGSVALFKEGRLLAYEESMRQGSHSDVVNVFIQKVLDQSDIQLSQVDLFVTGIGPGSFTGIRISLNTIKTLAYCHQKPVLGLNSLLSLASGALRSEHLDKFKNKPIVSMINAYKNMCYVATHRLENSDLIEVKTPEVVRVQNFENYLTENSVVCGDAYATYEKFFPQNLKNRMLRFEDISDESNAKNLVELAHKKLAAGEKTQTWNELLPLYLRASEAEENLQGIKYQPLF